MNENVKINVCKYVAFQATYLSHTEIPFIEFSQILIRAQLDVVNGNLENLLRDRWICEKK